MNNETLLNSLTDISDKYICEAAPTLKNVNRKSESALKNVDRQSESGKKIVPFRRKLFRAVAMAASLFLIFSLWNATTVYAKPVSYISMDVNPSIELCLNKWNKVIEVKAYNDAALYICSKHSLENCNYIDAIKELMDDEDFQAYCKNESNSDLTITIVSDNYAALESEIKNCNSYIASHGQICYASKETAKNAHESNCSIGKYAAYEELHKYDSSVSVESCNEMTMHELHQEIESHHSETHNSGSHNNDNHNNDSHNNDSHNNDSHSSKTYSSGTHHNDSHSKRHN